MPKFTGAEIVFKVLEDRKVEHVFGYPGGAVLPIYDELKNHSSIKHIFSPKLVTQVLKPLSHYINEVKIFLRVEISILEK